MITERDLQEAIAECQGKRNPDANTCIKLAAFYTIRNELYGPGETRSTAAPVYSYAAPEPQPDGQIDFYSGTEFSRMIDGRKPEDIWPIIDELVTAVQVLNPKLYNSFMEKLE